MAPRLRKGHSDGQWCFAFSAWLGGPSGLDGLRRATSDILLMLPSATSCPGDKCQSSVTPLATTGLPVSGRCVYASLHLSLPCLKYLTQRIQCYGKGGLKSRHFGPKKQFCLFMFNLPYF